MANNLFYFILLIAISYIFACQNKSIGDDTYYRQYILDDHGIDSLSNDNFKLYSADLTGDSVSDHIYVFIYMDNYFGYCFNGKTRKEIHQDNWGTFISKPGQGLRIDFDDLVCDQASEILQYSISGQENNIFHQNIYKVYNDSLFLVHENISFKEKQHELVKNTCGKINQVIDKKTETFHYVETDRKFIQK